MLALTPEAREAHDRAVLNATVKREAIRKKEAEAAARRNDYSNSFSGTADDTKNEAEAASLLKGGDGDGGASGSESKEGVGEFAILRPLPDDLSAECLAALEARDAGRAEGCLDLAEEADVAVLDDTWRRAADARFAGDGR